MFQTNETRMEIIIKELRNVVFLGGIELFKKILVVLQTEPIFELADHIESKHCTKA